jgi:hypothetical protein
MSLWHWYIMVGVATALAVVAYMGKTSDSIAQMLPVEMTQFQFKCAAMFSAIAVAIAWPAFWWIVYDQNRPQS